MAKISDAIQTAVEHHRSGRLHLAEEIYRRVLAAEPDCADALYLLGILAHQRGCVALAREFIGRAAAACPGKAEYQNDLGNVFQEEGSFSEAVACYRRALLLDPTCAEYHFNLGNSLASEGHPLDAIACYERSLQLNPGLAEAHNSLAYTLYQEGKWEEAIACIERALRLRPEFPEAFVNRGLAFQGLGQVEEAIDCYRRALQLRPNYAVAHSDILVALHYRSGITLKALADAHAQYEQRHAAPLRTTWRPHENVRDPDRRLRLGFVSPDLGRHPVGWFLIGVLQNLDRDSCEVICYSDRGSPDDLTSRLRTASTAWRHVNGWPDHRLAEQIRSDRVDILFDLAGHTAFNRLLMFARKPAPVQITWLGYEGTTGLGAMDYLLADQHVVGPGAESWFREKVLRMPDGYVCFAPPRNAPPVGSPPALTTGQITFGCFNNPAKISSQTIATWARILRRLPQSRLTIKYRGLDHPWTRARVADRFAAAGASPQRLRFVGASPYGQYLASYQEIDIGLDPFPFNGGVTTCDALWMGVPVVTCPGETFASRHSLSHLSNAGSTETIARDLDDYVDIAVRLASDLPRLAAMRAALREQVARSPLCDGKRFAANLMRLLRDAWRRWCSTSRAT